MDLLERDDIREMRQHLRKRSRFTVEEFTKIKLAAVALKPFTRDLQSSKMDVESWSRCGCMLVESTFQNALVNRRHGSNLDAAADFIVIHRFLSGGAQGYLNNNPNLRQAGGIYYIDLALPWEGVRDPGTLQSIYIQKSLLEGLAGDHIPFLPIAPSSPMGRCILAHMDELFGPLRRGDELIVKPVLEQFLACVRVAIGAPPERRDVRAHLREAMFQTICEFIECQLESPDLTTGSILGSFGVSRASLYRMFEPYGGVRNYITERRALRAIFDLALGTGERGQVRVIGEKWGFPTPVEFNRTIKRLYEQSPGKLFSPANLETVRDAA